MNQINEDIAAYLNQVVEEEREADHDGAIEKCMSEIGKTDKNMFGISAVDTSGAVRKAANAEESFPLESVSKALSLALALEDNGAEKVFKRVSKEPTGDPYHSIAVLEEGRKGVPPNPMINAGAIAVTAMIHGSSGAERFERLLNFIRTLADNSSINCNKQMLDAEAVDLNRSLYYYMRHHSNISGSEEDGLMPYVRQTAIEMNCVDLARIAAVFANQGKSPGSGKQLIDPANVRIVLTLMFVTGMYGASGSFAVDVGIPSKSGVSGAIMSVVPGRMGLGLIGPALDKSGNSMAGVRMLNKLSQRWQLAAFS